MLRPTPTAELHLRIEQSARSVKSRSPEQWLARDIIAACEHGRAFCFVSDDRKTTVVLEPIADDYPTVHIWIAHSAHGSALKTYEPVIERLSRTIGAKRMTFSSKRKGYQRAMPHWQRNGNHYQRILKCPEAAETTG